MANKISVLDMADAGKGAYFVGGCRLVGDGAVRQVQPDGWVEWAAEVDLATGSELSWTSDHGDEIVFVERGRLRVGDDECGALGAVIVEGGARAQLMATEPSHVLHFGSTAGRASASDVVRPSQVHVLDSNGRGSQTATTIQNVWYADSTCDGCALSFLRVWSDESYRSRSHSHSSDELIFVTEGTLQVGAVEATRSQVLAIPGDVRYGFLARPPWGFVNFRRGLSYMTRDPKQPPRVEVLAGSTVPAR